MADPSSTSRSCFIHQPLAEDMQRHLFFSQAKAPSLATRHDHYRSLALAVRDRLLHNWSTRPRPTPVPRCARRCTCRRSICWAPTSTTTW